MPYYLHMCIELAYYAAIITMLLYAGRLGEALVVFSLSVMPGFV